MHSTACRVCCPRAGAGRQHEGGDAAKNALLLSSSVTCPTSVVAPCSAARWRSARLTASRWSRPARCVGYVRAEQGDGGFGYDPLFAADGYDVSTAQLRPAEKDRISDRGHALTAIAPHVRAALG